MVIGNVGHVLPALHALFTIPTEPGSGANPHNVAFAACAGKDASHEKALIVGKTLALVGYDILTNDKVYQAVKADWEKSTGQS